MEMIATNLLRISTLLLLVGLTLGIVMGARHDFSLAPAHAHLNLLGFVSLFLAGLYYHAVPAAAASRLATIHAWLAVIGAISLPIGIGAIATLGEQYIPLTIGASFIVLVAAVMFAIIVFRFGLKPKIG
jgi:cbb3-type cytochrome oxidase subunit 1